ncbi:M48 family metalloprotease [Frankia sp. AgB1.9]|uniref:M56 family metallopeptidase n=1 Tax=unclassified Frankia TaxID=2632575 RepID=UPI00193282A5|nr:MULTISPECIES: M56 family metallopeptidase [unclassified Frankia]MBL7492778.1 M48 family metalloprotease [Frankia sp. AgW1.1]MBL7549291.1 M48 family metalloprotease [Frankia sp. AgB1.9]MBL7619241.1 M48 family metalloprotease [Frankia sp. AgB1.8]
MTLVALVPFVSSVLLAGFGPRAGRRLPPASAAWLLTIACLTTALAMGFVLAVAGFVLLARLPAFVAVGHWSAGVVRGGDPLPASAGLLPAAAMVFLLAAALWQAVGIGRDLAGAERACRRLGPAPTGLIVIDDEHPDAYTLPGLTGRIVVSTAMLRALPADERRVLLAHEDSHLRHRHHLFTQLADLAATANPLLRGPARAVRLAAERWADEDAATGTGDRTVAARALARAGLARAAAARGHGVLAAVDTEVGHRTRALLQPAPPPRRILAAGVTALIVVTVLAAIDTEHRTERRFEHARTEYARQR